MKLGYSALRTCAAMVIALRNQAGINHFFAASLISIIPGPFLLVPREEYYPSENPF